MTHGCGKAGPVDATLWIREVLSVRILDRKPNLVVCSDSYFLQPSSDPVKHLRDFEIFDLGELPTRIIGLARVWMPRRR